LGGRRVRDVAGQLVAGAGLLSGLPGLLRSPMRPPRARQILRQRLDRRGADFLELLKRAVFGNEASPYLWLFRQAGCTHADVARIVARDGLEAALGALHRSGVYLTVDEMKGRQPVRRGAARFELDPAALRNPLTARHVPVQTGGSRGERALIPLDVAWFRDRSVDVCLWLEAIGGFGWRHAALSVPGGMTTNAYLEMASVGVPLDRWFTPVDLRSTGLDPRYRWSARLLHWTGRALGRPLPRSELVDVEDLLPIARWMADARRSGGTPHLLTVPSLVVRVCGAAAAAGIDLSGGRFLLSGEPTTRARLETIRRAGGHGTPRYGTMEAGPIGFGCTAPTAPDDVHLLLDLHAVIRVALDAGAHGAASDALLISSLRPTAPLVLLNASLGDVAELTPSTCGCPLEALGWATHLHHIRSFEKLTTGGMTFLDSDVIHALEEALPEQCGGGPGDYQLTETEDEDGWPRLELIVHPRVGPVDEPKAIEAFYTAIGRGVGAERLMALHLRRSRLLRVRREAPRMTPGGKIQHLHAEPRGSRAPAR
jgi:hypothetical protein